MKYLILKSGKFVAEYEYKSGVLSPVTFDIYGKAVDYASTNVGRGTCYIVELVPVATITKEVINRITIDPLVK